MKIPPKLLAGPWMTDHESSVVAEMMKHGWDNYDYVESFESKFADWHERKYALMTPCCTHAIHLLLLALDIKKGDEVIAPECTWTGSIAPITYTGATPVFADIDDNTWCLSAESIEKRITSKTRAIIVVDLYGNMPEMLKIQALADEHGIYLIEDAAEALGSTYKGVRAGKFGIGGVHSFHRTKTIATGEGGALLIDDDNVFKRAKFLRDHGRSSENPYFVLEPAPKYMPSNLQGSLASAQFDRIDELVGKKMSILHQYKEGLASEPDLQLNMESDDVQNGAWATTLVMGDSHMLSGAELRASLESHGIASRPFFYPMSSVPAYKRYMPNGRAANPNGYRISEKGVTLPSHFLLEEHQLEYIINAILTILRDNA